MKDRYHYTSEALNVFPRYNVLNAIRVDLERLDPQKLQDFNSTKELILIAGSTADDDSTVNPIGVFAAEAMVNERKLFCKFVEGLCDSDLQSIEPLPYQRVLSQTEADLLWSRIRKRWQITEGYWFPLAECSLPDVVAFRDHDIADFNANNKLDDLLLSHGIQRILEMREYGPEYEQDVTLFDPQYNGAEGYWTSEDLDWIVYASHESTITVGGWLLEEIKKHWPGWSRRIWRFELPS